MKLLLTSTLLLAYFMLPQSQVVALDVGEITLPEGFVHKRIGMTDSLMGEIRRSSGTLVISYDIGPMAGIHMHPQRRRECTWFQEQLIEGRKVYLGLIEKQGKRELIVTMMMDEGSDPLTLPANFRATVRNKRDIADVKKIAASYRPKRKS
jgi:hypothetical protein